jgi:MFS family permease
MSKIEKSNKEPFAALKLKEFRNLLLARFMLVIAIQIQGIVLSIQIYELTHSPLSLGMIGLAEVVPNLIVLLYAGYLSDRYNRKKIILICIGLLFICMLGFYGFTAYYGSNHAIIPILFGLVMITGIARGFFYPSNFAFFTSLIPKHLYANAATWNSTAWQTAAITGPALGGIIYALSDAKTAYLFVIVFVFIAFLGYLRIKSPAYSKPEKTENIIQNIKEGWQFVFSNPLILGAITLDMFAVLLGGAEAMIPVFANEILHVGKAEIGILRAAPSIGAVIMAIIMVYYPIKTNAGKKLILAMIGFGASIILFGLSTFYALSFAALFLTGMFDNISVVVRTTIVQSQTPDHMRGRVSSVNSMFITTSNELGAFESGVSAKFLGTVPSVIIGGCLTIAVVLSMAIKSPSLRKWNGMGG